MKITSKTAALCKGAGMTPQDRPMPGKVSWSGAIASKERGQIHWTGWS